MLTASRRRAASASYVWTIDHEWHDQTWMQSRGQRNAIDQPISIYEVHLGSWMRPADRPGEFWNYRDLAPREEILNSDVRHFGGGRFGNLGGVEATPIPSHDRYDSLNLTLPPLGMVALKARM